MIALCRCADRGYVRSLEETDFGFPAKVDPLGETPVAMLGRCRQCGTWWERLPHWVYGYAWYRTEQRYWAPSAAPAAERAARRASGVSPVGTLSSAPAAEEAIAAWSARRQEPGI